jgi:uncharacterized protein
MLHIEIVYALPEWQVVIPLVIPAGTTIATAIARSDLRQQCPGINLTQLKTGIYGRLRPLDYVLSDGDRIELYRPLLIDPKQARVLRAARNRTVRR